MLRLWGCGFLGFGVGFWVLGFEVLGLGLSSFNVRNIETLVVLKDIKNIVPGYLVMCQVSYNTWYLKRLV